MSFKGAITISGANIEDVPLVVTGNVRIWAILVTVFATGSTFDLVDGNGATLIDTNDAVNSGAYSESFFTGLNAPGGFTLTGNLALFMHGTVWYSMEP